MGDDLSTPSTVDSETDYGYGVQDETDAEEGQTDTTDDDDEDDYGDHDDDYNKGGFVTDNRQMPSGFRPLGFANGGSMGFRPIGAWSNGGPVVPPINIQSVANIPIQSAANVPLANYQPSTPYVYPDPPATPTPGTTPTGTENTFFAADPDKYTVPTPFAYGTTTPPPGPPPGPPPPPPPDPWTPSPGWTIDADGNISLDEDSAPSKYWQTVDDEDVFDEQWFLSEAYNNQLFQGNPNYHIDETVYTKTVTSTEPIVLSGPQLR